MAQWRWCGAIVNFRVCREWCSLATTRQYRNESRQQHPTPPATQKSCDLAKRQRRVDETAPARSRDFQDTRALNNYRCVSHRLGSENVFVFPLVNVSVYYRNPWNKSIYWKNLRSRYNVATVGSRLLQQGWTSKVFNDAFILNILSVAQEPTIEIVLFHRGLLKS